MYIFQFSLRISPLELCGIWNVYQLVLHCICNQEKESVLEHETLLPC